MFVLAGEGGGEGVCVGDVAAQRRIQAVGVLVRETMRDEGGELVGCVGVRAKQFSKIEVRDGGPFRFRAELGSPTVTQFDSCCSVRTWVVFMRFPRCCLYSFTSRGACIWSTGSQVLSLSG